MSTPAIQQGCIAPPAAAMYLALSKRTLEVYRRRGEGPPYARVGRRIIYRLPDLDKWVEQKLVTCAVQP